MARGWNIVMSLVGWLIGIALAPVFIIIGLAAIIIETLFEDKGIDEDE